MRKHGGERKEKREGKKYDYLLITFSIYLGYIIYIPYYLCFLMERKSQHLPKISYKSMLHLM